jgi:hypothetical protein
MVWVAACRVGHLLLLLVPGVPQVAASPSDPGRYDAVKLVDEHTSRGVPMVELGRQRGDPGRQEVQERDEENGGHGVNRRM